MRVTSLSHPRLCRAFEVITRDSGGFNRLTNQDPECWTVPDAARPRLAAAEAALVGLSDDDLATFVSGEMSDQEVIAARSPALAEAHRLLNDFFENWET